MQSAEFNFYCDLGYLFGLSSSSCLVPFISPFTVTVPFHCTPFTFLSPVSLFFPSRLSVSFHLSTHTTAISSLCLALQPSAKKENGKTANPAASYGIRVYQPIMPFSDLFSSRDRSLCACIPPPPHPPPFPYHPTKAADAVFSAAKPPATLPPTSTTS